MLLYLKKRKNWLHVIFWLQHPDHSYANRHCIWPIEVDEIQINLNVNPPLSFSYSNFGVIGTRRRGLRIKIPKQSLPKYWNKARTFFISFPEKSTLYCAYLRKSKRMGKHIYLTKSSLTPLSLRARSLEKNEPIQWKPS